MSALNGSDASGLSLFDLSGKVAVVTGGSRGIGKMIARALVCAGVRVYVASRSAEACEATAAELSETGECFAIAADLSSSEGCHHLAEVFSSREGPLHILVNNAGATWGAPLADFPDAAWDRVLNLNLKGVFQITQQLLPALSAGGSTDIPARVINIGSCDGLKVPIFENYAYSASKAAVHHLTRHLAVALAPTITVNAIAPGPFETRMMAATLRDRRAEVVDATLLKRIGAPDDIGGAVIFLASRAASYVTGAVLPVDGGVSAT
jgi:NAD(P)-dependent dehydrogenase (short-subunit alcohol dehydrogenase family)